MPSVSHSLDAPSPEAVRVLLDLLLPGSALREVHSLPGSFSNATHLVDALSAAGEPVRLVVRRYATFGSYDRGEKARREYGTLELLQAHGIPAPRPLYLDADGALLGSPGIVTTYMPGRHVIASSPRPEGERRRRRTDRSRQGPYPWNECETKGEAR